MAEFDFLQECLGRRLVLGDDAVGVVRAVGPDMVDRRFEAVDDAHRNDRVEIFGPPVLLGRRRHAGIGLARGPIAPHRAALDDQRLDERLQHGGRRVAVHEQRFCGAADARAAHLRVDDDANRLVEIGRPIDIDVNHALEMSEDGNPRLALHPVDEALAAARHDDVERPAEALEHFPDRGARGERRAPDRRLGKAGVPEALDEAGVDRR